MKSERVGASNRNRWAHYPGLRTKSRLGEKLTYIHNHWEGLQAFLTDGRIEIDSNRVENLSKHPPKAAAVLY